MNTEQDRNPSPPPEYLQNYDNLLPDRVGDSVFSKHWLIKILMNIVETVNKEVPENSGQLAANDGSGNSDIRELDPKLDDDACSLWDMSANKDVAQFLAEFNADDIFVEVIYKTKSPRLLEIGIGILGNMASFDDLCQTLAKNDSLLKAIIPLTGSSDAPTVIQVLRFIHTCVVNEKVGESWLEALCDDVSFMDNIRFMLENSLNGDILKGSLQLLYYVLDKKDDLCVKWAGNDYAKAIATSGKQLLDIGEFEAIDELWLLLNLMFQHDENIGAYAQIFDEFHPLYSAYLMRFGDYEYCGLPPLHRVAAVAACFTTLATLLKCVNSKVQKFSRDDTFLKYIKNMFNSVTEVLEKGNVNAKETDETPEDERMNVGEECDADVANTDSNASSVQNATSCNNKSPEKIGRLVSLHEDDYNSLFIFRETLIELCGIVMPSLLPKADEDG